MAGKDAAEPEGAAVVKAARVATLVVTQVAVGQRVVGVHSRPVEPVAAEVVAVAVGEGETLAAAAVG